VTPCEGYSAWLAAEDVLPIVLGSIGFVALGRRTSESMPALRRPVSVVVGALIIGSAIAGPTRKAAIAVGADCEALQWMQIPFFLAIPIGFAVLAWALRCVLVDRIVAVWPYAAVAALAVVGAIAVQRDLILLAVGGLLAVTTGVTAAVLARTQGDRLTAVLFVVYCVGTLALPGVAGAEGGSPSTALWAEQAVNTLTQGLFALASVRLLRSYRRLGQTADGAAQTA
jgi:hypothetical protein